MRLVLEGPDGGGKTGLRDRLLAQYSNMKLMDRACTSEDGPLENLVDWVNLDLDMDSPDLSHQLYDRHPLISELIYSPSMGREMPPEFQDVDWLTDAWATFRRHPYIIIWCMPSRQTVIDNVKATHLAETEHQHGVVDHIGAIYDLYHIQMCREVLYTGRLRWNYEVDMFQTLVNQLNTWMGI